MQNTANRPKDSLALKTIVLYNLAGFSFNVYDTALYAWLPYFYSPPREEIEKQLQRQLLN